MVMEMVGLFIGMKSVIDHRPPGYCFREAPRRERSRGVEIEADLKPAVVALVDRLRLALSALRSIISDGGGGDGAHAARPDDGASAGKSGMQITKNASRPYDAETGLGAGLSL
jgi:hypothetical protein